LGIGIVIAKRVIQEYHNGDIKIVQTEVGKGTTFRITVKKVEGEKSLDSKNLFQFLRYIKSLKD
jgi:signal transduction histidine kinase